MFWAFINISVKAQLRSGDPDLCNYTRLIDNLAESKKDTAEILYLQLLGGLQELEKYREDYLENVKFEDVFPAIYYHVTRLELLNIKEGTYQYPIWKMNQMLAFYEAYDFNRKNWDNANKDLIEPHWKKHFDNAEETNKGLKLCWYLKNTLESSIEAHIIQDLPRSIRFTNNIVNVDDNKILESEFNEVNNLFEIATGFAKDDIYSVTWCDFLINVADWIGLDPDVKEMRETAWKNALDSDWNIEYNGTSLVPQPFDVEFREQLLKKGKKYCDKDAEITPELVEEEPGSEIEVIAPHDPNDIIPPKGIGPDNWISNNQTLFYTIRCENDPVFATAPAQVIEIQHPISPNVDIYSISLGDFGFANHVFEIPENKTFYSKQLDLTSEMGILVNVTAGLDVDNNEAFWYFESIDPQTGLVPEDPLLGLLPVNDTLSHIGEGFVSYFIQTNPKVIHADSILAVASIVFDENEAIETPKVYNLIDAIAPESQVVDFKQVNDNQIELIINSIDQGAGVKELTVYYSSDGESYRPRKIPIEQNQILFDIQPDIPYYFYSIAEDFVGNIESKESVIELKIDLQ